MTLPPARTLLAAALAAAAPSAAAPVASAGDPQARPPRPAPASARIETLAPDLEATLAAWYDATRGVKTLEGGHTELQTVHSAGQETHRVGRFFYAEPDRGRIDLKPGNVAGVKPQARPGEPYAVVAGPAETWVCDGAQVVQLDEPAKEARVTELPPDQRGENIINGPLPFLLGVPPRVLKERFRIRFVPGRGPKGDVRAWLADPTTTAMLELLPRRAEDAQNWSKAMVMLSKPAFLPRAVKLYGPAAAGQKPDVETVYAFNGLKPNRSGFLKMFRGDPFAPDLAAYTTVRTGAVPAAAAAAGGAAAAKPSVPSVVSMPYKMAAKVVRGRGYEPKLVRGPATDTKALVGKIAAQSVPARTQLPPGSPVELEVYVAPRPAGGVRPAGATREAAAGR